MALREVAERARVAINLQGSNQRGSHVDLDEADPKEARLPRASRFSDAGGPSLTTLHVAAWRRLLDAARPLRDARRVLPTGADWRKALAKIAKSAYTAPLPGLLGPGLESYVPFRGDLIAEPPAADVPMMMLEVLPVTLAAACANIDKMLVPRPSLATELRTRCRQFCKVLGTHAESVRHLNRRDVRKL